MQVEVGRREGAASFAGEGVGGDFVAELRGGEQRSPDEPATDASLRERGSASEPGVKALGVRRGGGGGGGVAEDDGSGGAGGVAGNGAVGGGADGATGGGCGGGTASPPAAGSSLDGDGGGDGGGGSGAEGTAGPPFAEGCRRRPSAAWRGWRPRRHGGAHWVERDAEQVKQ